MKAKRLLNRKPSLILLILLAALFTGGGTPLDYTGPDRTVTESHVETYDYGVWARPEKFPDECAPHTGGATDCVICTWERSPGSGCGNATYWYKLGTKSEVVTTTKHLAPATVSAVLDCPQPGAGSWCAGAGSLQISGIEPLAGEQILAIEGTRNGENFACPNLSSCAIPLVEGPNDFNYWAVSSWGDTSLMGNSSLKQDSQAPQIAGNLSGTPGEGSWYVSAVDLSGVAADPTPGSGLAAFEYALDGAAWAPFPGSLTLTDGVHSLTLRACDVAGNCNLNDQTISVDSTPPQVSGDLSGTDGSDGWIVSPAGYSVTASDPAPGSGLNRVEVSVDGGGWQSYTAPLTLADDGLHSVQPRAIDLAGNQSLGAVLDFKLDGHGPRIELPAEWTLGQTASFSVKGGASGLGGVEVIISDPQGRWPRVVRSYQPTSSRYDGQISWDRKFADGTIAPLGDYPVTVKAMDGAGNFASQTATIHVSLDQVGPALVIPLPATEAADQVDESLLPKNAGTGEVQPQASPPTSPPIFGGQNGGMSAGQGGSTFSTSPTAPVTATPVAGVLFGTAAVGAMAGIMAYVYEERRKRKEQEAREAREAAKKAARLNAEAEAAKVQNYLDGKAAVDELLAQAAQLGVPQSELENIRTEIESKGIGAALVSAQQAIDTAQQNLQAQVYAEMRQAHAERETAARQAAQEAQHLTRKEALLEPEMQTATNNADAGQPGVSAPQKEKTWWDEKILDPLKNVLNPRTLTGVALTLVLGGTAVMARNIINDPHVFDEVRVNARSEWQQVVQAYPQITDEPDAKFHYMLEHPYEAVSGGYEAGKVIVNTLAGYVDTAWQQHPVTQLVSNELKTIGQSCPEILGENWFRRCEATFYFGASVVDHPMDSTVSVATSLVADPLAGLGKLAAFDLEYNNPVRVVSDLSQAIQENGLQSGTKQFISDRFTLTKQAFSDPQVQTFLFLAGLLGIAAIPLVGGLIALGIGGGLVLGQTISTAIDVDQKLQKASTREKAMRAVTDPQMRRRITINLVLLALVAYAGAKGMKNLSELRALAEVRSPAAQIALIEKSPIQQLKILETARSLKISPEALDFYLEHSVQPDSPLAIESMSVGLKYSDIYIKINSPDAQLAIQELPFQSQLKILGLSERPAPNLTTPVLRLTPHEIETLIKISTQNYSADYAVLGTYSGGKGYTLLAENTGSTVLNMPEILYNNFYKDYPADFKLINEGYIMNLAKQRKPVILSVNHLVIESWKNLPADERPTTYWEVIELLEPIYHFSLDEQPFSYGGNNYDLLIPPDKVLP